MCKLIICISHWMASLLVFLRGLVGIESEEQSVIVVIDVHLAIAALTLGLEHVLFLFLAQLHSHGL